MQTHHLSNFPVQPDYHQMTTNTPPKQKLASATERRCTCEPSPRHFCPRCFKLPFANSAHVIAIASSPRTQSKADKRGKRARLNPNGKDKQKSVTYLWRYAGDEVSDVLQSQPAMPFFFPTSSELSPVPSSSPMSIQQSVCLSYTAPRWPRYTLEGTAKWPFIEAKKNK